ncbi:MAG: trehalose-6-phosphate synthase [Mycobacteriales bacterium]|nr:trehalose-6-phosphate synthase [Frankia sp.]
MSADVVVASNRGPVSFQTSDDGSLVLRRGGGGLVSGLRSAVSADRSLWVCAALSDSDRQAASGVPDGRLADAGHDVGDTPVRMLAIDPVVLDRAYNSIANRTLWFVSHELYDTPNRPSFDAAWRRDWQAYVDYNTAFAEALAAEAAEGARVAVQDYHMCLVPAQLRALRPDVRIGHFSHTPWAPATYFALLPDDVAAAVVHGLLGADHIGFHTARWAQAFLDCARAVLGHDVTADADSLSLQHDGRTSTLGVYPLGVDGDELRERAGRSDVQARAAGLRSAVGDRQLIVRVDRTELSKNIVRGLAAYRELLRTHTEWHGRVVHVAFAYPSRHDLPEYREYTAAVQRIAVEINDEFTTPGWQPLQLAVQDDYPRSLAALMLADVLVVNPLRDGMNLVAKEGPVLSTDGCALVLSREAGAADELGADAIVVNPFDVSATAEAMHAALSMPDAERRARCDRLATQATALPPQEWLRAQLDALLPT